MQKNIKFLKNNGYHIWKSFFNEELINKIRIKADYFFDNNISLGSAVNATEFDENNLKIYGSKKLQEIYKDNFYINKSKYKNINEFRHLTPGISLTETLINIPEIYDLIVNDEIIEFIKDYMRKDIYIGYVKLRKFFKNDIPNYDTNFFHSDDNCDEILKTIIYLDDIKTNKDGPLVYIKGSNNKIISDFNVDKERLRSDSEMLKYFKNEDIKFLCTKKGSVIFADTKGYHKGLKPLTKDRYVLFINYVCEEEYGGQGKRQKISKKILQKDKHKKDLFSFFDII